MSLRKKFFLSVVLTLTLVLLAAGVTSNRTTMEAFRNVERQFFRQDMARVQNLLDAELLMLRRYASDWGAWDSMYFFMENRDRLRFDEMIDGAHLRALDIDFLVLFDNDLLPVVAYTAGPEGNETLPTDKLLDDLKARASLFLKRASAGAYDDLLVTVGGGFLVGIGPVLTTSRAGPPRGVMLVGASLSKRLPAMRESLGTDFDILPVLGNDLPDRSSGDVRILTDDKGDAAVWQRRGDGGIRIEAPRTIYEKGGVAVVASLFWIVLGGIGILLVVTLLLENFVLSRLKLIRKISDRIASEGLIGLRVPVRGRDEIAALSNSFNMLLHTLESLVMDIPDALFLTNADDDIVLANGAARAALGYDDLKDVPVSTVLGRERTPLYARDDNKRTGENEECPVFEASLLRIDGTLVPVEVHRQRLSFGGLPFTLLLARDLTERKHLEERLARKAYFDDLTGLPNRNSFIKALNRTMRVKEKWAVALLNMDHFKLINAQVGNLNGDRVLVMTAERIKALLEPPAQLYRTGGDEFAVLFPLSETTHKSIPVMESIVKAIAAPCPVETETVFPCGSLGVVPDIAEGKTAAGVIDAALQAITQARKGGLGRVAFYRAPDSTASVQARTNILTLQAELQAALEKDEFIPFFQPIFSLDSDSVCGFETLARWRHPRKGVLSPLHFVPQAEQTGFITRIDLLMMEHALRAVSEALLRKPDIRFYFTANASPLLLGNIAAVESVKFLIESTGADPELFTMEVTESAFIENMEDVHKQLDRLKACGIKIALDDFGTGYSSLQYINRLPFDCIKLDRAFVNQLFQSEKTERMMRTIIAMGRDLGLDVIAEGVETAEQVQWLKNAGCAKVQGFYFSKPVPWREMERMIREV